MALREAAKAITAPAIAWGMATSHVVAQLVDECVASKAAKEGLRPN